MSYELAEKFKSIQGEGIYTGTPMAFIRFTGCSVGKTVCHHCDTDFDKPYPWRGGGIFSKYDLDLWAGPYQHICLTGGEPFNQHALDDLVFHLLDQREMVHIETSGTVEFPRWVHSLDRLHICVSPKPGYLETSIAGADEIKVIMPGLGNGEGWPLLEDALRWAREGNTPIYLQPRNSKFAIDANNLRICQDIIAEHPELRLSTQMHKILHVQ